jgi:hypothetical protein
MTESLNAKNTACKAQAASKARDTEDFGRAAKRGAQQSALPSLKAALNLVDDVNPALAADQTVVAVATTQGLQRITDLHGTMLSGRPRLGRCWNFVRMGKIPQTTATRDRRVLGHLGLECQSKPRLAGHISALVIPPIEVFSPVLARICAQSRFMVAFRVITR